ncbi:hypothetical protein BH23BAC4_BH23BAC4_01130 [soil metagenome]
MTFQASGTQKSPSGVEIARDFRDNLIIDRYDPVFADMRASKIKHLRSANSEDAVTWNVFRSLRQIAPTHWLPTLWHAAFPGTAVPMDLAASVALWVSVPPPLGLLAEGDEGASEIDIVIESATWVWFIEAKYRSDISLGTTTRPDRDQILRNLDVGSYYAGVRPFYFSLLAISEQKSPNAMARVQSYADFGTVRSRLRGHRPDGVANLSGVGAITWHELGTVLQAAAKSATRDDERAYARRAGEWLHRKIAPDDGV